ncbi:MAG: ADP-ribosylation factor-like protein [Steroidobacter sp.]
MAVIDPNDGCVVIRIVYDGAPMAGKTTSVATLGRGLGASVFSPADLNGRTLYFDWLDYTGGLFEGRRIRCQIVTVPGQAVLAKRRRRLLESADVVVFVGDSSSAGFAEDKRQLRNLRKVLSEVSGPPVGIVLQANKRDHADAMPMDKLRDVLDEMELRSAVIESVATEGTGIREAFVFAVRLALDRVRELMNTNALKTTRPKINSAQDLLQDLKQAEDGSIDLAIESGGLEQKNSLAAQALEEALQANIDVPAKSIPAPVATKRAANPDGPPAVPDEKVASGLVWPPVDGRVILHETTRAAANLQRAKDGAWTSVVDNRWSLHSAASALVGSLDSGRGELIQWARLHLANNDFISKQRCVVLADDGTHHYRLWQIVRSESSLRARIEAALSGEARGIAKALLIAARAFLRMAKRLSAATCELPLSLEQVSVADADPIYVGWMPQPSAARPPKSWSPEQALELLVAELGFARAALRTCRTELIAELARVGRDRNTHKDELTHLQRLVAIVLK